MRNTIMLGAGLLALSACSGPEAVWLFTFGEAEITESNFVCNENLNEASCPEPGDNPDSEWTVTETGERSDSAGFGEILDGPKGEKYLVMDGEIYVGEKSGGNWRFEWEYFQDTTETQSHTSGYDYTQTQNTTTTYVVVLDISGKTATGDMLIRTEGTSTVTESDTWISDEVGLFTGQLFDDAPVFLEGEQVNYSDENDCAAEPCLVEATIEQTVTIPLDAFMTSADHSGFDGVDDAYRDAGNERRR